MDILHRNYPIPTHPTWNQLDSTKLNTYQACPRKYFFNYVLGLKPDYESVHLVFGSAIHEALEHLLLNKQRMDRANVIQEAFLKFFTEYRATFTPDDDALNKLKTPEKALEILNAYDKYYLLEDSDSDVLYTEVAGTVPVDDENELHFKLDSIIRDSNGIYCLEHKTTSADSKPWQQQWIMSLQVGTYHHVLYTMYPANEVYGVVINGIIPRTKDIGFRRVPVRHSIDQMQIWNQQVRQLIHEIDFNFGLLSSESTSSNVLQAFPLRTTSCVDYGTSCPYISFCSNWKNPLHVADRIPLGFKVDFWDPQREHANSRYVMQNGTITLSEQANGPDNTNTIES